MAGRSMSVDNTFLGIDERLLVQSNLRVKDFVWMPDDASDSCIKCEAPFTLLFRRHHCRRCGILVCGSCLVDVLIGAGGVIKSVRLCKDCAPILVGGCRPATEDAQSQIKCELASSAADAAAAPVPASATGEAEEKDEDDGSVEKSQIEKLAEQAAAAASEELKTFWLSLLLAEIPKRGIKLLESGAGLDVHVEKDEEEEEEEEDEREEEASEKGVDGAESVTETVDESDDDSVATSLMKGTIPEEKIEEVEEEEEEEAEEEEEVSVASTEEKLEDEEDYETDSCCSECHQEDNVCHVCAEEVESHCEECHDEDEPCEACQEEEEESDKIIEAELGQVYNPAAAVASIFLLAVTLSIEYHI